MADDHLFENLRREMVHDQLAERGIRDRRVLQAMTTVPREAFVSPEWAEAAYADSPLPIPAGQTISQPYTVAFMCEAAGLQGGEKVLEVGTGSGYGAAVLSLLAAQVHTIERIPELSATAAERLQRLGMRNVTCHVGDGTLGLPAEAPFDAIIVTAAPAELPGSYGRQLVQGGRIIIPVGRTGLDQQMFRYTLTDDGLVTERLGAFAFVPLIGSGVS